MLPRLFGPAELAALAAEDAEVERRLRAEAAAARGQPARGAARIARLARPRPRTAAEARERALERAEEMRAARLALQADDIREHRRARARERQAREAAAGPLRGALAAAEAERAGHAATLAHQRGVLERLRAQCEPGAAGGGSAAPAAGGGAQELAETLRSKVLAIRAEHEGDAALGACLARLRAAAEPGAALAREAAAAEERAAALQRRVDGAGKTISALQARCAAGTAAVGREEARAALLRARHAVCARLERVLAGAFTHRYDDGVNRAAAAVGAALARAGPAGGGALFERRDALERAGGRADAAAERAAALAAHCQARLRALLAAPRPVRALVAAAARAAAAGADPLEALLARRQEVLERCLTPG